MKSLGIITAAALASGMFAAPAMADSGVELDLKALIAKLPIDTAKVELQPRPIPIRGRELEGQHDCLWMGPIFAGAFNIAYPDGGAVYWPTTFTMPEDAPGAYLEIKGAFPQARYMSVHTYTTGAKPYDRIMDTEIIPDEGATNPYLSGSYGAAQTYTLRVVHGEPPEQRAPNTLYFGPEADIDRGPVMIRHYIPETGDDLTGGAGLPEVALVMPGGERVTGEALCEKLGSPEEDSPKRMMIAPALTQAQFDEMLEKPAVAENYLDTRNKDWSVFWDPRINIMSLVSPRLQEVMKTAARVGFIPRTSGFYANLDNQYVSLSLNDKFGDVVMLEAKMPRTPLLGKDVAKADEHDLRYWSLCTNEGLVTTRFSACIYDSEVTLDPERRYRIVISKAENRPDNARPECGVTWLDWGDAGDGAGHPGLTALLLRNMAPSDDFPHAVQRIPGPGLEAQTMGPYLPKPVYGGKAEFEARGC